MQDTPKSATRHCFYQPQGQSTRDLTGFTPHKPTMELNRAESAPTESTTTDALKPYRDDDDEEEQHQDTPLALVPPPPTMKPMSVTTDYDMETLTRSTSYLDDRTNRMACFAAVLSVIFLILGYWISLGHEFHRPNHQHPNAAMSGSDKNQACVGYDGDYFTTLLQRAQQFNQTQLCRRTACKCLNPFVPAVGRYPEWSTPLAMNMQLVKNNYTSIGLQPDVVLFGDSITEHLLGRSLGRDKDPEIAQVTQHVFTKRGGGRINGLPMGIAADTSANLLYRLQNGEMPKELQPSVWWILIGINDVYHGCSLDAVVAGNIRIVQEIRNQHNNNNPNQHKSQTPIVINSILPSGNEELHSPQSLYLFTKQINRQLDCYAEITEGVYFVNATDTLTESSSSGTFLKEAYFAGDNLHPTAEGSRQWEELIVASVLQLLA